jgi:hypothetical protein
VFSCARANYEDSHPREFTALVFQYLQGDYVDDATFSLPNRY